MNNSLKDEYKKDLEIYYKNVKAAKAVMALMRFSKRDDCANDWVTLDLIMQDIVTSLSDPEVKVDYCGKIKYISIKSIK